MTCNSQVMFRMHCEQLSFVTSSLGLSEKLVDAGKLVHISDVNERT